MKTTTGLSTQLRFAADDGSMPNKVLPTRSPRSGYRSLADFAIRCMGVGLTGATSYPCAGISAAGISPYVGLGGDGEAEPGKATNARDQSI